MKIEVVERADEAAERGGYSRPVMLKVVLGRCLMRSVVGDEA